MNDVGNREACGGPQRISVGAPNTPGTVQAINRQRDDRDQPCRERGLAVEVVRLFVTALIMTISSASSPPIPTTLDGKPEQT